LRVLPLVRREADSLRREVDTLNVAVSGYRLTADSLRTASAANASAFRNQTVVASAQAKLTDMAVAKGEIWRRKAQKRGLLNWLGAAGITALTYIYISH